MYIPEYYKNENEAELLEFIHAHSFGLIINNGEEVPYATHLPFTVEKKEDGIIITSHYSAANPQAKATKPGDKVTVIFSGPHSYISPTHYDAKNSVPTWNYIAVHAHGEYHLLAEEEKDDMLRKMIATYEPEYEKQYDELAPAYLDGMKKGIVGFSVRVFELQGKYKLSQNKKQHERDRITNHLDAHPETKELADYMTKDYTPEKQK